MIETFLSLFSSPQILKIIVIALVVGLSVSVCSALLGVNLVLKKYAMIGDGLSHVGYGALSIAAALKLSGNYTLEIALPIVIVAAFFILKMSGSKVGGDAAIAVVSVVSLAVGTILLNLSGGTASDACNSLFGSASLITITEKDMVLSLILSAVVIALYVIFWRKIFLITFDEDYARAIGLKVDTYNLVLSILTAVTIVLGMQLMGAILISGLIILPTLTALKVSKSFLSVLINSVIISSVCFILGFTLALILNLQMGPSIVVANFVLYLLLSLITSIKTHK